MKKKILLTLLSIFLLPISVYADNGQDVTVDPNTAEQESEPVVVEDNNQNSVISTNQFFELKLIRGTQNPLTKGIPYTLYITPKIDSEKTQIQWEVPSTLVAKPSHKEFVNLKNGQTYTYRANILPQREGTYDVTVNVIAWQYNVNYTNSVSSTIKLSKGLVVQPVDSGYTITLLLIIVLGLALIGAAIFFIYKSSDKIMKKIKIWLTPPY